MLEHNRIERRAYLTYHQDGLPDIFLALVLLAFGLGIQADMPWLGGVMAAVLLPNWLNAKRLITAPRLAKTAREGTGAPEADRLARRSTAVFSGMFVIGLLIFALLSFSQLSENAYAWLRANGDLAFGLFLAVFLAEFGIVFSAKRFYAYASLAVALFLAASWLNLALWTTIAVLAGCILLAGLLVMASFLRQNPREA